MKKNKSYAILGMGRFGRYLADELCANGADVLIADSDEGVINQYASKVSEAIIVNLMDPEAIKKIGLSNMDLVFISMGSSLEASIMCISVAKEQGVPKIIAKASSERMGQILKLVGADEIVYPEKEIATQTVRKILSPNILEYFVVDSNLSVISMKPKDDWIGKPLSELRLRNRYHINVVAIRDKRGVFHANIDPSVPLTSDMNILVIGEPDAISEL